MSTKTTTLASPGTTNVVAARDLSADGRYLAYFEQSFGYRIADLQTGASRSVVFGDAFPSDLSADGTLFTYSTKDSTGAKLFLWDSATGASRVIASLPGTGAFLDPSFNDPTVSVNNGFVYFTTIATLIAGGNANGTNDLFRFDIQAGTIDRVYQDTSVPVALSADGRYAVVGNFLSGGIFRLDMRTGAKALIGPGNINTQGVSLSSDGRYAVFNSFGDLVPGDTNGKQDVYLRDFSTGELRVISTSSSGVIGNGDSSSGVVSADGSRVVFVTKASNLSSGANSNSHVVVKDLATGILTFVGNGSEGVSISADGMTISFNSVFQLAANDTDNLQDAYVVRFTPPTLFILNVSGDNFVNAAEAPLPVTVSGLSNAIGRIVQVTSPTGATASATVASDGTWSATFNVSAVQDGTRAFTATVVDDANHRGNASKDVIFDRTAPTLLIQSVTGDDIVNASEASGFTVSGMSDAIGQLVSLSINGAFAGFATVTATGAWSATLNFTGKPDGSYELGASVSDAAGNQRSTATNFALDATLPALTILPISGDNVIDASEVDGPVTVRGTSDAIGRTLTIGVGVAEGGFLRGAAVVQANGAWQADIDFSGLGSGPLVVTASVSDAAGNLGADTETVLVDSNVIRVSVKADGSQVERDTSGTINTSVNPSMSANGRLVAFSSFGGHPDGDIVPGASNTYNVVVKDVQTGAVTLVSKALGGQLANGESNFSAISADGRFVAFVSYASNLVANDTNQTPDVFIAELSTGVVRRVSTDETGAQGNGTPDYNFGQFNTPAISADGRYVAFVSEFTNLVPGTITSVSRVYVKDMQTGHITLASPHIDGTDVERAYSLSITADGRFVTFKADGGVFIRDLQTLALNLIDADAIDPVISADGSLVVFNKDSAELVDGAPVRDFRLYVRDINAGTTTLVSPLVETEIDPFYTPGETLRRGREYGIYSISADNRYVAFVSSGSGAYEGADIYVRDLLTGTLTRVSSPELAAGDRPQIDDWNPRLSADGRYFAFQSEGYNNVPGDTNFSTDIFLRRLIAHTLTLDPIAGDDRITASEASAALPISGRSSLIGGAVTIRVDGVSLATATVQSNGTWSTALNVLPLTQTTHSVTATVVDGAGFTSSDGAILQIDPRQTNSAPSAPAANTVVTNEDTVSAAIAIGASDPDGDALTYALKIGFGPAFGSMSFAGGNFTYTPNANADGSDAFTIVINDGHGGTAEQAVSVTVNPVNDAPSAITVSNALITIAENTAARTKIADVVVSDPDTQAAFRNNPVTVNDARFEVVNGELFLKAGQIVDFEAAPSISLTLSTGAVSTSLTLGVSNAIEEPSDFDDDLVGTAGNDIIDLLAGNDKYSGGAGDDQVFGGGGNDTLEGGVGADTLDGGAGINTASYGLATAGLRAVLFDAANNTGDALGDVYTNIQNLTGSNLNDELFGNSASNNLSGGGGSDALFGLDGDDTLIGGGVSGGGYNQLWGGNGLDAASYAAESTSVTADLRNLYAYVGGVAASDLRDTFNSIENVTGGSAADVLIGDSGVNLIEGGGGADQLYGFGGADTFVYRAFGDSNVITGYDTIADFIVGIDKLDLRAFSTDAAHVQIFSDAASTVLYVEATLGSFNPVTDLAISLIGTNALTTADIVF